MFLEILIKSLYNNKFCFSHFRVVLDTAVIYDLKQRTHRKIAKLPDTIQNPAVCVHNNSIYVSGQKNIYQYEDLGQTDRWSTVILTDIRPNCMTSFNNYIYCTQNYFSHLYRFRPGIDTKLQLITYFTNPPAAICHLGKIHVNKKSILGCERFVNKSLVCFQVQNCSFSPGQCVVSQIR